jgi:hypothetical protein
MFPVANDFAAIARRLKEIEVEVAKERAVADARRPYDNDESRAEKRDAFDDISACA